MTSIAQDRKTVKYRFLEGIIGYTSIIFMVLLVVLSFFEITRIFVSLLLIVYSFFWILRLSLNANYTIYSYKQIIRWENFNWDKFYSFLPSSLPKAINQLSEFRDNYKNKIDWKDRIQADINVLQNIENTKFANFSSVYHINIFSVYNESADVLIRSLKKIYESGYDLSKIIVFVSQEARNGEKENIIVRESINKNKWVNTYNLSENDLDIVYSKHFSTSGENIAYLKYKNKQFEDIKLKKDKLNIIFTQHPDGLVGEIKGKASNEDWGGRQASLFVKVKGLDPEMVVLTSLDADSHINKYFYHNLSYRFCLTPNRLESGFQPVHIYSNNLFHTGIWPRQVAAQTTLHNMGQLAIEGETSLFAIYSLPLIVLQKVDFWVREVISEDSTLFIKCLIYFKGNFNVLPFYGVFEGDAVESEDYIDAIFNQYQQLQRWAWGGVEGFPFMFKKFFWEEEGSKIDLRIRIKWVFLQFSNHFFWSSSPIVFSVGIFLPQLIGGSVFKSSPISQNLALFSQYFTWISILFLITFSYITIRYTAQKATKNTEARWYHWVLVLIQCAASPIVYFFMGIPGIDAQIRGITGNYLSYLVTPKK